MKTSRYWRIVSLVTAFSVLYSSTATGANLAATSLAEFISRAFQIRPGPFTERPRPIYKGSNPKREPKTRGGLWSASALQDAATRTGGPDSPFEVPLKCP